MNEQPTHSNYPGGCMTFLAAVGLLTIVIAGIMGSIWFTQLGAVEESPRWEEPTPRHEPVPEECVDRGPGLFGDDDRRFGDSDEPNDAQWHDRQDPDAEARFADDRQPSRTAMHC